MFVVPVSVTALQSVVLERSPRSRRKTGTDLSHGPPGNPSSNLPGYASGMSTPDDDRDHAKNDAFEGLALLAGLLWGPFRWPLIGINAVTYGWCVYSILS
jgi:hypothetical protein